MARIQFTVNKQLYSAGCEVDSDVTLNDYLRKWLNLRGTKYMCREGGCGACVVAVTTTDPDTQCQKTFSVNSCLVSITSCKDWEITTIEEVGNRKKGYHPIQKTLAKKNGTQCGYCSPGWVMSMYSLLKERPKITMAEIEDSFGSNTCRCTGYRSIMDAHKSFACDAPITEDIIDIEDLTICDKTGKLTKKDFEEDDEDDWCVIKKDEAEARNVIRIELKDNKVWYRVNTVADIFEVWRIEGDNSYMLVAGNTGKGAYPIREYPRVLIDISGVNSLKGYTQNQNLVLNAGTTISDAVKIFDVMSNELGFDYLKKFVSHLSLVAHIPVKNIGTVAGNLMLKHQHNEFSSDLFLLFQTVGAAITIQSKFGTQLVSPYAFLATDMRGKVIINIKLPPLGKDYTFISYKIMPRGQNAHAIVNAGFLYKFKHDRTTVASSNIVFGGLSPRFVNALNTEVFLFGKNLFRNETLQGALKILQSELVVEENPPEPSSQFRKKLALGLFYKGLLEICPPRILVDYYTSGAINQRLTRPVSHGTQVYDTNETVWPLNKPIPKVEALIQCSGEAPYVDDIPTMPREVYAAFVLSTIAVGAIDDIDPSPALNVSGVIAFYSARDIPGQNNFTPVDGFFFSSVEEILCNGNVKYFNQPIGIIVAETEKLAENAAKLVKVTYKNVKNPVLSIAEAKKYPEKVIMFMSQAAKNKGVGVKKVIGTANIYSQYHYTMETQQCVTVPSEEGLDVYPSTQWMDKTQWGIAQALNIDKNRINLSVKRLGGAYGAKISRAGQIAIACSLVSHLLNRPCRFLMPLTSTMRAIGKRFPCSADFEADVSHTGEIQYLKYNMYDDNGYVINEPIIAIGIGSAQNCYNKDRWDFKTFNVVTDNASNSWCRSPGTLELIAMIEFIMEQISYEMSLDPIDVRVANLLKSEPDVLEHIETIKTNSDYENRRKAVQKFNSNNKWKKRGLRFTPLRWSVPNLARFAVTITIYHGDGTIAITHAGIELGQGINTKAIQVCAYSLNVPIEKIKVKASNVLTNPNSNTTGGSFTSEGICAGIIKCCKTLQQRLAPIQATTGDVPWEELIKTAHDKGVDLFVSDVATASDLKVYNVYGATVAEVEVDILTGEFQVLRVDILEDVGQSLSPEVDVGQVEGAFIMGLGYWTCEHLVYNNSTGELLTDRSWNYHVPLVKDIPIDFRVNFKRNSYNDLGVLGSKATGEPAICMTISVAFAIREAIASARADRGIPTTKWFNIDGPCTNEAIVNAAGVKIEDFKFY